PPPGSARAAPCTSDPTSTAGTMSCARPCSAAPDHRHEQCDRCGPSGAPKETTPAMGETDQSDAHQKFSGTMPVREVHQFDVARLEAYMAETIPGFSGPLRVEQFKGGQSCPTYKLTTPTASYVLRRKPPGKLLPSAHAVDREYRVI